MNLARYLPGWCLDHLSSDLPDSIQDLLEMPGNCLIGSPEGYVNNPEPLIMTDDMKEHDNLLFHRGVDVNIQ